MTTQGNIEFEAEEDSVRVTDKAAAATVAALLDVQLSELLQVLCHRVIAANGEVMLKQHTMNAATYGRDALAKVLFYSCYTVVY